MASAASIIYSDVESKNARPTASMPAAFAQKARIVGDAGGRFHISDLGLNVLTYGVAIAVDASLADICKVTVTDGVAFAIGAPSSPSLGQVLSFDVLNSSGGAMGALTWNAVFKLGGAFTAPASTKRRTISFYYDGTNWVEISRAAADI